MTTTRRRRRHSHRPYSSRITMPLAVLLLLLCSIIALLVLFGNAETTRTDSSAVPVVVPTLDTDNISVMKRQQHKQQQQEEESVDALSKESVNNKRILKQQQQQRYYNNNRGQQRQNGGRRYKGYNNSSSSSYKGDNYGSKYKAYSGKNNSYIGNGGGNVVSYWNSSPVNKKNKFLGIINNDKYYDGQQVVQIVSSANGACISTIQGAPTYTTKDCNDSIDEQFTLIEPFYIPGLAPVLGSFRIKQAAKSGGRGWGGSSGNDICLLAPVGCNNDDAIEFGSCDNTLANFYTSDQGQTLVAIGCGAFPQAAISVDIQDDTLIIVNPPTGDGSTESFYYQKVYKSNNKWNNGGGGWRQ